MCFSQSKDGKTRFAFYLKDEQATFPYFIDLPADFTGNNTEIRLLGYKGKLQVQTKNGLTRILIPKSIAKEMAGSPALVFWIDAGDENP